MPMLEFFVLAAEAAPEVEAAVGATEALTAAEAASAAEAGLTAAEVAGGVGALGEGITAAEALTAQGIAPTLAADVATGGAGAGAEGINALQVGAEQTLATAPGAGANPAGIQLANAATTASDVGQFSQDQQILDMMKNYNQAIPPVESVPYNEGIANIKPPVSGAPTEFGLNAARGAGIDGYSASSVPSLYTPEVTSTAPNLLSPGAGQQALMNAQYPTSPLQSGFDTALSYMDKHPFQTAMLGYGALNAMGAFNPKRPQSNYKPYSGSLSKYSMSPNFQPSIATPNVYRPRYALGGTIDMFNGGAPEGAVGQMDDEPRGDEAKMASGGITSYARGDRVKNYMEIDPTFLQMIEGKSSDYLPESVNVPRTGINYDLDPDTRYKDALTAAEIRMGKINAKGGVKPYANLKRPTALGTINLAPPGIKAAAAAADEGVETAARGGIMQAADHYAMGGYASGNVPRLLKGPGDGMSDDIPATIDGRQPARLADGEFVIPADVVSGLGNGSTDAGAKHLHKMMTNVRKARTGNPKQGKQIIAEKFMPKKGKA